MSRFNRVNYRLLSFSEIQSISNSTSPSISIYPKYLKDILEEIRKKEKGEGANYYPGLIQYGFADNKGNLNFKATTISYLNNKEIFDIFAIGMGYETDNDLENEPNYLFNRDPKSIERYPQLHLINMEKYVDNTILVPRTTKKEFELKTNRLELFKKIFDTDYYGGGAYILGKEKLSPLKGTSKDYEPYNILFVHEVTNKMKAHLWIRGVPIEMNSYQTSYNTNSETGIIESYNYIIQAPNYLLKYIEDFSSVDFIRITDSKSPKVYYSRVINEDLDDTSITINTLGIINRSTYINLKGENYLNKLASLNLI